MSEEAIARDGYGRPKILPDPTGNPHTAWLPDIKKAIPPQKWKPKSYTRVSTMSKALDSQEALSKWKMRMVTQGFVRQRLLLNQAARVVATSKDNRDLQEITDKAFEAGGGIAAREAGSDVHAFSEFHGDLPPETPPEYRPALEAMVIALKDFVILDTELFVVHDELMCAGTMDRLVLCPDGHVRCLDFKTGRQEPEYGQGVSIQTAIYIRGKRYDPATGERTELYDPALLDLTETIMAHVSIAEGTCTLYRVPAAEGWDRAQLAAKVKRLPRLRRLEPWI